MESKKYKTIIAVLGVILLVTASSLVFSVVMASSRISALNALLASEGEKHAEESRNASGVFDSLKSSYDDLTVDYEGLQAQNLDIFDQLSQTSRDLEALQKRMMCPSTIPFVDYSDDGTVSAALKEYTSDYKATDDSYEAVQAGARITYHKLKSNRTQSFFIVFFADGANGRVNGVFDVLGQCWVNLDNR